MLGGLTMEFWKMNGAGNDFIIIDNRSLEAGPDRLGRMARALCRRRFSIGADGLMAVEPFLLPCLPLNLLSFLPQKIHVNCSTS